jgi:hypothetical protein
MSSLGLDPNTARRCSWPASLNDNQEKKLTGAVFLDVAKAFDTVWIDGLLYN